MLTNKLRKSSKKRGANARKVAEQLLSESHKPGSEELTHPKEEDDCIEEFLVKFSTD